MTEVYLADLTKKNLAAMPTAERSLLLLLGHARNEITVFSKLSIMAGMATSEIKFIDYVQVGQVFVLMRVLIGKLHEAWELFRTRFQSDRTIADIYMPKLNIEAKAALNSLKKHFGKQSPLTRIRNGFSFHYKDEKDSVEKSFLEIPDDEFWQFYFSNVRGNSFFYASELVIQCAVIKLANLSSDSAESYVTPLARSFKALC